MNALVAAMLQPLLRSAALVPALFFAAGCFGSDAAYSVKTHNATDIPIVLLQIGVRPNELPPIPRKLAPGETWAEDWRRPAGDEPPATVRAEDQNGTLIFCRRFSYPEIKQAAFRIEIVRGEIRCGP